MPFKALCPSPWFGFHLFQCMVTQNSWHFCYSLGVAETSSPRELKSWVQNLWTKFAWRDVNLHGIHWKTPVFGQDPMYIINPTKNIWRLKTPEPLYLNTRPSYITFPETNISHGQNPPVWWYSPRVQMEKNLTGVRRSNTRGLLRVLVLGWCKVTPFCGVLNQHMWWMYDLIQILWCCN